MSVSVTAQLHFFAKVTAAATKVRLDLESSVAIEISIAARISYATEVTIFEQTFCHKNK